MATDSLRRILKERELQLARIDLEIRDLKNEIRKADSISCQKVKEASVNRNKSDCESYRGHASIRRFNLQNRDGCRNLSGPVSS